MGEEIHAGFFDQFAQPFHQSVEGDDVVAFVLERRRRYGKTKRGALCEKQSGVIGYGSVQRGGLLEIGDQFGESFGIHDGAGELVSADFAALFEDVDIFRGKRRSACRRRFVVLLDEIG